MLTFERLGRTKFIFQYLFIIPKLNYAQKMSEKFSRPSRDNRPRRRPKIMIKIKLKIPKWTDDANF